MKTIIITSILFICLVSKANPVAGPISERYTHESDLRPYINWIAKNTRFVNAENINNIDLPVIVLLDNWTYNRIIDKPSLAFYRHDRNEIVVNQDKVMGQPDIILHELIHFYQFKEDISMPLELKEKEAYELQAKFRKQ